MITKQGKGKVVYASLHKCQYEHCNLVSLQNICMVSHQRYILTAQFCMF